MRKWSISMYIHTHKIGSVNAVVVQPLPPSLFHSALCTLHSAFWVKPLARPQQQMIFFQNTNPVTSNIPSPVQFLATAPGKGRHVTPHTPTPSVNRLPFPFPFTLWPKMNGRAVFFRRQSNCSRTAHSASPSPPSQYPDLDADLLGHDAAIPHHHRQQRYHHHRSHSPSAP